MLQAVWTKASPGVSAPPHHLDMEGRSGQTEPMAAGRGPLQPQRLLWLVSGCLQLPQGQWVCALAQAGGYLLVLMPLNLWLF